MVLCIILTIFVITGACSLVSGIAEAARNSRNPVPKFSDNDRCINRIRLSAGRVIHFDGFLY